MIKDFGNCGNYEKVVRIQKAIKSAKQNQCGLVVVLDPLVYGTANNCTHIKSENIAKYEFAFTSDNMHILYKGTCLESVPWWDIIRVNVVW